MAAVEVFDTTICAQYRALVILEAKATNGVAKKASKQHYPAPYKLIDLWQKHMDNPRRMLEKEIRAIGILGAVIVHESEPPFIKATIGAMTNAQHKSMMKLFTYENGDRLYYGYKVQLNMFLPRNKKLMFQRDMSFLLNIQP